MLECWKCNHLLAGRGGQTVPALTLALWTPPAAHCGLTPRVSPTPREQTVMLQCQPGNIRSSHLYISHSYSLVSVLFYFISIIHLFNETKFSLILERLL